MLHRPTTFDTLEDAAHLLRAAPASAWAAYYAGALGFWVALLRAWADMTTSHDASSRRGDLALVCALAYVWMKCWQSAACRLLIRRLFPALPPLRMGFRDALRFVAVQAFLHVNGIAAYLLGIGVLVPLPWVTAYFHGVTVLGLMPGKSGSVPGLAELHRKAATVGLDAPKSNAGALTYISVLSKVLFLGLWVGLIQLFYIFKMLLDADTVFTRTWTAWFNPTLLAVVVALTALAIGPLLKALYVVRAFRLMSRESGQNLQALLDDVRHERAMATRKGRGMAA
jgi:hypothetical protein